MELWIVRHGQTPWNVIRRLQGRSDIDLNENGIAAAASLGEKIKEEKIDRIFSSPLHRAVETATLIKGSRDLPIETDDRLCEISFGDCEGMIYFDWIKLDPEYDNFFTDPAHYTTPPNGESFADVCVRTKEFLKEVIEPLYGSCDRILIVAHGALNKGLMCYLEGNDVEHFWGDGLQGNCELTKFEYDGQKWSRE